MTISSPEPLGTPIEPASVRWRPSASTIFKDLLQNHLANQSQFFVEPPWERGTKVCINGPGHMTKMAAHIW